MLAEVGASLTLKTQWPTRRPVTRSRGSPPLFVKPSCAANASVVRQVERLPPTHQSAARRRWGVLSLSPPPVFFWGVVPPATVSWPEGQGPRHSLTRGAPAAKAQVGGVCVKRATVPLPLAVRARTMPRADAEGNAKAVSGAAEQTDGQPPGQKQTQTVLAAAAAPVSLIGQRFLIEDRGACSMLLTGGHRAQSGTVRCRASARRGYSQYPLMYHPCALLCQRLHSLCDRYDLYSTFFNQ